MEELRGTVIRDKLNAIRLCTMAQVFRELVDEPDTTLGFDPSWGSVKAVARFNGPSGAWVHESLLMPLGYSAKEASPDDPAHVSVARDAKR